jgi:hypothetical protein
VRAVLAPVREAWQQMLEERPWEVVAAFFNAVDWKVRDAQSQSSAPEATVTADVQGCCAWQASVGQQAGRRP